MADMRDMRGWQKISCTERDEHYQIAEQALEPVSSLTDPDGQFGTPIVFTEWARRDSDESLLRDYRWPAEGVSAGARICEHYFFVGDSATIPASVEETKKP